MKIILASDSTRRKQLLQQIGLRFKIVPSKIEENLNPRLKPRAQAERLSIEKAKKVGETYSDSIIIAADTFVVLKNEILGKPKTIADARRMLKKLNGTSHTVITGYTILNTSSSKRITHSSETTITMKKLTSKEIESYLKNEQVLDKAGAYGIQEKAAIFVEKINGDFFNVVGLPIAMVAEDLKKFGISVL